MHHGNEAQRGEFVINPILDGNFGGAFSFYLPVIRFVVVQRKTGHQSSPFWSYEPTTPTIVCEVRRKTCAKGVNSVTPQKLALVSLINVFDKAKRFGRMSVRSVRQSHKHARQNQSRIASFF